MFLLFSCGGGHMCTWVCVVVYGHGHVSVCTRVCMCGGELLTLFLLKWDFSLNLDFTSLARLVAPKAQGFARLYSFPKLACRPGLPRPAFSHGYWESKFKSSCLHDSTLLTEPYPQSDISFYEYQLSVGLPTAAWPLISLSRRKGNSPWQVWRSD